MPTGCLSIVKEVKEVPLVTFAHGTVKESRKRKLKISAYKDDKERGPATKRRLIVAESSKMLYKGDNFRENGIASRASELYIAEVNKETGKMTMFPAQVLTLHPVSQVEDQKDHVDFAALSFKDKSDLLTDAFGSGKQKRTLQKRQKNKMADGALTSAMAPAIDSAIISQQALPAVKTQQTSSVIPPCNLDAEKPSDVYNLNSIIGSAELDSLKNIAQDFCHFEAETLQGWRDNNTYFSAVLSRLQLMPMAEGLRLDRACQLTYLNYLLTVFHFKSDRIRRKDPLPAEWPDMVKHLMLNRFTLHLDGQRRCMPARLKDLLLSHILVLCLILDDFTTELAPLQTDLQVSAKKLQLHSQALGCKVKSQSSVNALGVKATSYTAMLKVPLSFPSPPKGRKSKN